MILLLSLIFFLLDFLLKKIIDVNFALGQLHPLIDKVIYLRLVHNTGAAFGLFQGKAFMLTLIGIIFIFIFIFWVLKEKHTPLEKIYLAMILGGAASNLYDRIFLGYVIDYIDLRFWPVFNLSDAFISLACIFILFSVFFKNGKKNNIGSCRG